MRRPLQLLALLGAVGVGGCATVDPSAAFIDVGNKVRERAGEDARFIRSPTEAKEIEGLVRGILKDELTAEMAARVALVNNRDLQATLQDLGIAQAEVAQASRISASPQEVRGRSTGGDEAPGRT